MNHQANTFNYISEPQILQFTAIRKADDKQILNTWHVKSHIQNTDRFEAKKFLSLQNISE